MLVRTLFFCLGTGWAAGGVDSEGVSPGGNRDNGLRAGEVGAVDKPCSDSESSCEEDGVSGDSGEGE